MSSCNHIFNNRACINLGFRVQACESLGPVDILINCAGFAVCGLFEETTVDQFKVNIHLFYCYSFFLTPATEKCNLMKWSWKHKATSQSGFSGNHLVGQSVGQSVSRSVSWSVSRSVSQSVGQSVSQSVCQLVRQSVSQLVNQSVTQSVSQSVSLSVSWSVGWSVSQSFIYIVRQSFHAAMLTISKNVTDLTNQRSFQLQAMINTNYLAGVYTSHSVVKRMKERRKGHIVFVSSIGGQVLIF